MGQRAGRGQTPGGGQLKFSHKRLWGGEGLGERPTEFRAGWGLKRGERKEKAVVQSKDHSIAEEL